MNRTYIFFVVLLLILQSCSSLKEAGEKASLTITPDNLELFVDQQTNPYTIPVSYTIHVPKNYIPSCSRLIFTPHLVAPDHEFPMTPVVITGKDFARKKSRTSPSRTPVSGFPKALYYLSDGDSLRIRIDESIPFQEWMPGAKLIADVSLQKCNRKTESHPITIARGVVYIPLGPGPVRVKYIKKEIIRKEEGYALFHYPVNGYIVDPAFRNNREQLNDMMGLIHKIKSDTSLQLTKIVITGSCSPDGSYRYNENLARKRAEFIRRYLIEHTNISPDRIDTGYIAEDWEGLKKLITDSHVPGIDKVLRILNGPYTDDQKEAMLQKTPRYNYIQQNFFPLLRKVTYEILYTKHEKIEEVVPE